jgi:hypothetical protein
MNQYLAICDFPFSFGECRLQLLIFSPVELKGLAQRFRLLCPDVKLHDLGLIIKLKCLHLL